MLNSSVLIIFILACLRLFTFSAMAIETEKTLPPILDHYPSCSYKIIKNYKFTTRAEYPRSSQVKLEIMEKMRTEAHRVGADALILVARSLSEVNPLKFPNESQPANIYRVSYEAELINNCIAIEGKQGKLAPYNHEGSIGRRETSTSISRPANQIIYVEKARLNHPQIANNEVSIKNGLYGISLGTTYLSVLEKLGDPSVEIMMLEGETVIGYGRRHWLHFQQNRLVKVDNDSQYLSSRVLNSVPLRDFFDDYKWKINDAIGYHSTLARTKEVLSIGSKLDENEQLEVQQDGNKLILQFEEIKDLETGNKIYILINFILQQDSYKVSELRPRVKPAELQKVVQHAYTALQNKQEIVSQGWADKFGEPLANITLSVNAELRVYSTNLLIKTKKSKLTTIHFIEQALIGNASESATIEPWSLGDFVQGRTLEKLEQYFLENAYSYNSEVEMEAEKYELSLFFEDINGEDVLYEAKLQLR